jgi:hypothetical protein
VHISLPAMPLFFQYKLPELMVRETAKEIAEHGLPIDCDFFRMPLMRRDLSNQHNLLMVLESRNPGQVFYASPMMHSLAEFNNAYNHAAVHHHSALFSPTDIGALPDNKQHVVSYQAFAPIAWRCSEPKRVKLIVFEQLLLRILEGFTEQRFQSLDEVAARTLRELRVIKPAIQIDERAMRQQLRRRIGIDGPEIVDEQIRVAEDLLAAREIARIGFGLEMVVAQPRI